jgi:hypothetical protein
MEATKELDMMKDGARRVQEFLAAKGIDVKHSMMLEALSAGFGSRNWRTVREKLNAPSAAAPTLESLDGLRWHVFAVYCDNDQPYNGYYPGSSAHEAMVTAQIERKFDDEGSIIDVHYVSDRLTIGKDQDTYSFDDPNFVARKHSEALLQVAKYARQCMGEYRAKSVEEADQWDRRQAFLEVIEETLADKINCELLDDTDKFTRDEQGFNGVHSFTWTDSRGEDFEGVTASEVLAELLDIIRPFGVEHLSNPMKTHIYHAEALLKYAAAELDYVFGYEI